MIGTQATPTARSFWVVAALALLWPLVAVGPADAQAVTTAFDGDPATTERIDVADPAAAALAVSGVRFGPFDGSGRRAAHAVLATVSSFADSLAGAALTTDGPLLLTGPDALDEPVADELRRVLPPGGTVYVLGGEAALSTAVTDALSSAGFSPRRLAGDTRVETALAVADQVRALTPSTTVLLARSEGTSGNPTSAWADSMTGGSLAAAAGIPILVTPTGALHPAVAAWLAAAQPTRIILLGGEAALSEAVADAIPGAERLSGPERTATAAAIAGSDLWPAGDDRQFVILDGGREDGWAYGLSGAGLAADAGAPPLMVVGGVTAPTRREVSTCGPAEVDLVVVGGDTVVPQSIVDTLTTFDGQACASQFTSLNPFDSCQATLDYFIQEGLDRVGPYGLDSYYYGAPEIFFDEVAEGERPTEESADGPSAEPVPAAPQEDSSDGGDASAAIDEDVSQTNVQEVGVDEPDQVKTNGDAAYIARAGGVDVLGLTPGEAPDHVTTLDVPGDAFGHELLLDDDVLLVLGRGSGFVQPVDGPPASTDFAPEYYYPDPVTHIARFDVSDPTGPMLLDSTTVDGDYRSARMIDGTVRLVTSSNPTGLHFVFPGDGSQEAQDAALAHNREVIASSTLDNWLPQVGSGDGATQAVDCADVFAPPGFSGIATILVSTIDVASAATPTSSAAVVAQGETVYASRDRLVVSTSQWGIWSDAQRPEAVTTQLHSFDISDPADTTYVASGEVPGYVLNSFAMSERDGYYRIATTTEPPWQPFPEPVPGPGFDQQVPQSDNGITVLTEGGGELFQVGQVFGLGEGERIFAVRYMGDLAAVVTFRQIDPLYLVDLTNPAAPRVTGELKIPGVSRYLHPLGPDHLLGVGQDGTDDGRLIGLQVNLFDIADRANPTRVDSLEFGPGDSPVEYDHKAFLFWSALNRALVPSQLYGEDYRDYRSAVQAIDIDTDAGTLDLAGQVQQPGGQGGYQPPVDRTFIADGTLYTLSYLGVGAHDLEALTDLGFTGFPGVEEECCVAVEDPAPPAEEPPPGG